MYLCGYGRAEMLQGKGGGEPNAQFAPILATLPPIWWREEARQNLSYFQTLDRAEGYKIGRLTRDLHNNYPRHAGYTKGRVLLFKGPYLHPSRLYEGLTVHITFLYRVERDELKFFFISARTGIIEEIPAHF